MFLKAESLKDSKRIDPIDGPGAVPPEIQGPAIQAASSAWYEKLNEQPGGDVRRRFVDQLGKTLRRQLREDRTMSHPGANGFSLAERELFHEAEPSRSLQRFLFDAVGYGDLVGLSHTTKNKAGESRQKFYLNQILAPHFQLTAAHTKEPLYWKVERVMEIAAKAELPFALDWKPGKLGGEPPLPDTPGQLKLFGE